jgi:hypothetical protein
MELGFLLGLLVGSVICTVFYVTWAACEATLERLDQ